MANISRIAIYCSFASLILLSGCNYDDAASKPVVEPQWVVIPRTPKSNADEPESLADLHARAEAEFISVQMMNGGQRMIIMKHLHGSIPDRYLLGNESPLRFQELDARLGSPMQWKLTNLQLIGVVKQPQGVAYVIPMKVKAGIGQLEKLPTRELDAVEKEALDHLRQGTPAIAQVTSDRVRMLGSIRVTQSCVECHKVPEGTLLGAFAYDLEKDPRPYVPKPAKEKKAVVPTVEVLP